MPRILISAGEPSGDLLAANLAQEIKKLDPKIEIWALGGNELAASADVVFGSLASHAVMGLIDPIKKIPAFFMILWRLRRLFKEKRFDLVVPVDFYGFNIRLSQLANFFGYPVIYYISPQIWASRPGRLGNIRRYVEKVLCLFPFEPAIYQSHGVPATFVGHPLVNLLSREPRVSSQEYLPNPADEDPRPKTQDPRLTIGLLPGSRPGEIKRHLPILLKTYRSIRSEYSNLQAILFQRRECAGLYPSPEELDSQAIGACWGPNYEKRASCHLILTASGLAALENMILGIPMLIFYGITPYWLFYLLPKIIRTPFVGMPNILAQEGILKEFIWPMTAKENQKIIAAMAKESIELLKRPEFLERQKQKLKKLTTLLTLPNDTPQRFAARELIARFS